MAKTLIRPTYQHLLDDIDRIYISSQLQARKELNKILTKAYWDIGRRIVTVEQDHEFRAQYGNNLINRLSEDLTEKHGSGFSVQSLYKMRRFYITHPKLSPEINLEWTKQVVLLGIEDDRKRLQYEKLAMNEGWTRAKLVEILKSEKQNSRSSAEPAKRRSKMDVRSSKLSVHRGQLYTYKASPGESGYIYIDIGFSITRQIKSWLQVEKGEIIQSRKSSKGFDIARSKALPKDLYTYKAYVDKVIDGDTLRLHIDLGFDTFIKAKVRLRGIDAPELNSPDGQRAKRYVAKTLKQTREIIVKTHWEDKYGRYLADVWADNHYLNQKILDLGFATRYYS